MAVSRRLLCPAGVMLVTMIGASIFFRSRLDASDFGKPLEHEAEKAPALQIRTPVVDANRKITLTAKRHIPTDPEAARCTRRSTVSSTW